MKARAGFTLTELLIAMILGALALALMAPMAQMAAREHGRSLKSQMEREAVLGAFAGLRMLALEAQPGRIRKSDEDGDWFEAGGACVEFAAMSEDGLSAQGPYLARLCVENSEGEGRSLIRLEQVDIDYSGAPRGEATDHILLDGPFAPEFQFAPLPEPGSPPIWSAGWSEDRAPALMRFSLGGQSAWPDLVLQIGGGDPAPAIAPDEGPVRNPEDPRAPPAGRAPPGPQSRENAPPRGPEIAQ